MPSGDPEPAGDAIVPVFFESQITLTWSGSEFATALLSDEEIRFLRFDADGHRLDTDWTSPIIARETVPLVELVWNGDGYGMFFTNGESMNLFFLRLDVTGKPIGEPVVVADEAWRYPAADLAPEGYVLAWHNCESAENCSVYIRLLGPDGSSDGLPEPLVLAESLPWSETTALDVARGNGGYCVSSNSFGDDVRIALVDDDLTEVRSSITLSSGRAGEVKWTGDSYVTAWNVIDYETSHSRYLATCVARFTPSGVLERPPVCNSIGAERSVLLAAGDNGLALVFPSGLGAHNLSFLRTDRYGVPIGVRYEFTDDETYEHASVDTAGTTWTDDGFAIVFGITGRLMLQRFERAR